MILRDIIQRVLSLYNKGLQSDDNRLKPRHVYNKLVTVRSLLLYQKSNKRQSISSWAYQTLPCVEMIKAPLHECPCIPPSGCTTMRSKYPIPEIISDINSPMLNSVTNLDGDLIFSKSSWSEKKYKKGNRYTSNKPDYFFKDNYLYTTSKDVPVAILIEAVFRDPIKAKEFPSFCKENCEDCQDCTSMLDMDFPLDSSLEESLINLTVEELVNTMLQIPQDRNNDGADDKTES